MKKYSLLFVFALFIFVSSGCSEGQPPSPTVVPDELTATPPPVEEPAAPEIETSDQPTPTESDIPAEEPTATLEPTPVPTEATDAGNAAPTEEPDQGTPEETDLPPKPDCEEIAAFYGDVTIPDDTPFRQGEVFTKIWKVRNEGTCTWDANYTLVFAGGSQMNGASASPLPNAAPGDIIEIPIELTAPSRGGTYVGNWMFSDPYGTWFGVGATRRGEIWVRITTNYISTGGSDTGGTEPAACGSERNTASENEILSLINNARTSNGLPALTMDEKLTAAALRHSNDMACNDFVDHSGSDGTLWYDRITAEGYDYTTAKENIYVGDPNFGGTAVGAFEWWMNSQIHRENILSDDITEVGIAYVYNAGSGYGGYYTTVFARP